MSTEHLLGDLGDVLDALIGVDNQRRQDAESHLGQLASQSPSEFLLILAQVGAQGVGGFQLDQRLLSLILLRRVAFTENAGLSLNPQQPHPTAPFDFVPETTRSRIEKVLSAGLRDEMDPRLRKGLGVCVAEWVNASGKRHRPFATLSETLMQLAASPHPFIRFTTFQLLSAAPTVMTDVDAASQPLPAGKLVEILMGGLNDPSVDVRVEALKAMSNVLICFNAEDRDAYGVGLVEGAFDQIPSLPLDVLAHALEPMVDLASLYPDLFRTTLILWIPFLLMCAAPPPTLEGYQFSRYPHRAMEWDDWCNMSNMANEVLFSLIIADPYTATTWEDGELVSVVVSSLVGRQVAAFKEDGDSCEEWLQRENLDDEDETYPAYSEEMLDRLAQIIQDESVIKAVAEQAQKLLAIDDWRARYCALMAIASIVNGCKEPMQRETQSLLNLISPTVNDSHPRVRYGFLFCITAMCGGLDRVMQRQYSDAVLEVILRLFGDDSARVREAAAATLAAFFEPEDLPDFSNQLESILIVLTGQLTQGPLYVQEQILDAISYVAAQSGPKFLPYYRQIMDFNLGILSAEAGVARQKLVGRAMKCVASLAKAVGKENFIQDAVPLCLMLLTIQNQIHTVEDKRRSFLSHAWYEIAVILGKDFAPFLQFVIPPLLRAAAYQPEGQEGDLDDDQDEMEPEAYSSEMQEKWEAFSQLAGYVEAMGTAYVPFLEDTMQLTLAAIGSSPKDSEGLLESVTFLVPALMQVAKDANVWIVDSSNLEALFQALINALPHQYYASGVGQLYQSIGDSLRVIETPLPDSSTAHLARATLQWLGGLYERRRERATQATSEAQRGDYWLWADAERFEEAAEDEALVTMDTTWGRVVRLNGHAMGAMSQIVTMTQQVQAAAVNWGDDEQGAAESAAM